MEHKVISFDQILRKRENSLMPGNPNAFQTEKNLKPPTASDKYQRWLLFDQYFSDKLREYIRYVLTMRRLNGQKPQVNFSIDEIIQVIRVKFTQQDFEIILGTEDHIFKQLKKKLTNVLVRMQKLLLRTMRCYTRLFSELFNKICMIRKMIHLRVS